MRGHFSLRVVLALTLLIWAPAFLLVFLEEVLQTRPGYGISLETVLINLLGASSLIAGAFAAQVTDATASRAPLQSRHPSARKHVATIYFLLLLTLLGSALTYAQWKSMGIDPFTLEARSYYEMNVVIAEEGDIAKGFVGRLNALGTVGFLLTLHAYFSGKIGRSNALFLSAMFLVLLISPRRAALFYTVFAGTLFWYLSARPPFRRLFLPLIFFSICFVAFFGYTQFALGKLATLSPMGSLSAAFGYVNNNFHVMDALLRTAHFENTWIVLANPARIISQLFGVPVNVDLFIPHVSVPEDSNTVTAFYYFYRSGGFTAVFLFGAFFGFLSCKAVRLYAIDHSFFWGVASSLCLVGITLSIRECFFITYDFLYWLLVAVAVDLVLRKRIVWKREFFSSRQQPRPHPVHMPHASQR